MAVAVEVDVVVVVVVVVIVVVVLVAVVVVVVVVDLPPPTHTLFELRDVLLLFHPDNMYYCTFAAVTPAVQVHK